MAEPTIIDDAQGRAIASKLNWLRAGVLGANDGIVSTSSIIFGVAGAAAAHLTLVLTGIAAIAAGAMSMAVGEYISVSSQKDLEETQLAEEDRDLREHPAEELEQLVRLVEAEGIAPDLARQVAVQLTEKNALAAHARLELGIDPGAVVKPWAAALASMIAFTSGGLIPLLALLLAPRSIALWVSGGAVVLALVLSGWVSAVLGSTSKARSVMRAVAGGLLAMAITFGVGRWVGTIL